MQMLGAVAVFAAGVVTVAAVSGLMYAALPKTVLAYAERHGRFQGLRDQETLARGTRADEPPLEQQLALAE